VLTKHGQSLPRRTIGDRLRQRLAQATQLVGVTQDVCERLRRWCPRNAFAATFIPNGLDLVHWHDLPARAAAREKFGWPTTAYVLAVVARLSDEKDHATLLRALYRLDSAGREISLALAGEGPTHDSLERLCDQLGLRQRVHFLGTQADVRPLLAASDAFVLPSHTEGTPVSLLEAMAAGLPCIGTRVGGIPDVIQHRKTGLLVPPRAERALADTIFALFDDPQSAKALGQAARRRVESDFSMNQVARRYEQLYASLVARTCSFHRIAG
jgi:glycosyltransferase involved in cell wall biosynthesis